MTHRSLLSNAAVIGSAIVILLAARWIWVAGLGDYGWDYEVASRILHGEVFFRDFLLLRPPLSYYTMAELIRLLGHHLFAYHIHLWFSYVLCLIAGLLLARELGAPPSALITGVSLTAVMTCPVFSWGHSLDYQSVFLAGIGILCTLYSQRRKPWWAAAAGSAAALCIFHKQNVGLAVAICIPLFLPRKALAVYLAGFASVFFLIFSYFSRQAGAEEVWRQLFTDAASSKGGWFRTAARAVPRLIFHPDLPRRRWWELAATGTVYAAMLPIVIHILRRRSNADEKDAFSSATGIACLAGAGLGIALSLIQLEIHVPQKLLIHPWGLLLQLTYIFFFLLVAAHFRNEREIGWRTALFLVLAITAAQEASNPNFIYSATLVIPLLIALLARSRLLLHSETAGITVAAVYLLGTTVLGPISFYGLCAYQPTYPLPADSPFRGLRAPEPYARRVGEMWREVRPIAKNRRTLWLIGGGPFLAYGGLPVFNAAYSWYDSFPARLDRHLIQTWQSDPPEVVLLRDDFWASPKSELLTAGYIKKHVLSQHVEVWRSRIDPQISMWMSRSVVNASRLNLEVIGH
ncbi:MAG: hypothetical protein HY236_10000 [Acidobacteria bacterium]|nr:hypothetical protein [Acidobacteriota bacterium]